jgi:hypothetical protein
MAGWPPFVYEGVVGSGDAALILTTDVLPSTRDNARIIVILAIASIPAAGTYATGTGNHGHPADGHLSDVTVDGTTPIDPVETDWEPGCYAGWAEFDTFARPGSEQVAFSTDLAFDEEVIGTSMFTYVTAKHPAGTQLNLDFNGTAPSSVTSIALAFTGAAASPWLTGDPFTPAKISSGPNWAKDDFPRASTDCDGALGQYQDVLISPPANFGLSVIDSGFNACGVIFGYTRAYGLRARPWFKSGGVSGIEWDAWDPLGPPTGFWDTWGGTAILSDIGTIIWRRSGDPDLTVPWYAQWKMRVNPPTGAYKMWPQYDCPGNNTIGNFPVTSYNSYPVVSAGTGIKKANRTAQLGLAPCHRQVHITSEPTLTVPTPVNNEQ